MCFTPQAKCTTIYLLHTEKEIPQNKHYLSYFIVNFARILNYQCLGKFVYPEAKLRAGRVQ